MKAVGWLEWCLSSFIMISLIIIKLIVNLDSIIMKCNITKINAIYKVKSRQISKIYKIIMDLTQWTLLRDSWKSLETLRSQSSYLNKETWLFPLYSRKIIGCSLTPITSTSSHQNTVSKNLYRSFQNRAVKQIGFFLQFYKKNLRNKWYAAITLVKTCGCCFQEQNLTCFNIAGFTSNF